MYASDALRNIPPIQITKFRLEYSNAYFDTPNNFNCFKIVQVINLKKISQRTLITNSSISASKSSVVYS